MKANYFTKVSLGCLLCLLAVVAGCCINIGRCGWNRAKYEREVHLSAPLAAGSLFAAETHNGSIAVTGTDAADCNIIATIKARAASEEEAKELAEKVKVKLEPFGNKLAVKIEKPAFMTNKSVSVNLNVTVPERSDLELTTHNGAIRIANITGGVNGTTHNGKVIAEQVSGSTELRSHNGRIICKEVSGEMKLKTHNGKIIAAYSKSASPVCSVSLITHNGGIEFTAPPNFSAAVEALTHNGSIRTELPITVTVVGKISRRKLTGTIGTGEGKLYLETHNGSIKIR